MRVAFVPLAPLRDPAFVASAIAEALGLADLSAQDLPKRARPARMARRFWCSTISSICSTRHRSSPICSRLFPRFDYW